MLTTGLSCAHGAAVYFLFQFISGGHCDCMVD